jgi:putative ABC transport system permease protein
MKRCKWLMHVVLTSLRFRGGRSLLLLVVIAMASSLAASLGLVTVSMERRISEEVRKYGANLLLLPDAARLDLGSGALAFGSLTEPVYLDLAAVERALTVVSGRIIDHSLHLRGRLVLNLLEAPVEGVRFAEVRRMMPWWQVTGRWPANEGEVVVGVDFARRFSLKPGDQLALTGSTGGAAGLTVAGIVRSGGEEDSLLFLELSRLQELNGLENQISMVRVMADARSGGLTATTSELEKALPGAKAREVRQLALTSAALLKKVQLLLSLVTVTVLAASGASVTGTMGTTVLERSREIGLIKAMGATRRGTVLLFVAEACVLGLAGGMAGCVTGFFIAEAVSRSVFSVSTEFTLLAVPVALAVGLLIALAGSLGPLLSVYRLDPVQSLRGE